MSVFIEAETEPFEAVRLSLAQELNEGGGHSSAGVRRPVRGYEAKENSFAMLRVAGPQNEFFEVLDAAGEVFVEGEGVRKTVHYTNFFVDSVQEERAEKVQVVDTFGEPIVFFFGESPRVQRVSGGLMNSADFNWEQEFWANYEQYFRGSKLAQLGARLYLIYDDRIVEGLMLKATATRSAQAREYIPFTFDMFVTGSAPVSLVGDPNFPRPAGEVDYTDLGSYEQALLALEQTRRLQTQNAEKMLLEANRAAYTAQVGLSTLNNLIRDGMVNGGTPSISGFLNRAVGALSGARELSADLLASRTGRTRRTIPLRSTFVNNVDEFIGGVPDTVSESVLKDLSVTDQWNSVNLTIDDTIAMITAVVPSTEIPEEPFDPALTSYLDMMGRPGMADAEIREHGGKRRRLLPQSGSTRTERRSELLRTVPFGLVHSPGSL
jgi:hypothetical protein